MELVLLFSLAASFSFLIFALLKFVRRGINLSKTTKSKPKLPPGPWKLPLIGSMHHLAGTLVHRGLRDLARKHGPIMHLQLGELSSIVISSPRLAKEVMKTHDLIFADRPTFLSGIIILYNNSDIAFSPYGDYWRQMRKICTLELLSSKKVKSFRSIREDEIRLLVESCRSSTGSTINLSKKIYSLINSVVCKEAFGKICKDQDEVIDLIKELTAEGGGFNLADLFPSTKLLHFLLGIEAKLKRQHNQVDRIIEGIIQERRESLKDTGKGDSNRENEALLDVLLRIKESGGLEFPITSDNIKAVILDMFAAGTDASSATIEWAMSEIMRNPRIMHKAQVELREALKGKEDFCEADIQEMNYLKLVIKETLRLHPPVPLLLPREGRERCQIDGYEIPIKTKVIINGWAIGRDPEYWDEAESFIPERFEKTSVGTVGNEFEYIPFGAGRRMCPGVTLGLANVELPLAQLLYHFDWKLPQGMKPGDLDMSETFGATVKRKNYLYLIPTSYPHSG